MLVGLALSALAAIPTAATTREPVRPLADRVREAEKVFVGTLVDRVEDGDWVRAELRVDQALRGVAEGDRVEVIWRRKLGDVEIFTAAEGDRGVALLKDRHAGRYWLRADKFEPVAKLDEVRQAFAGKAEVPTFEEWVEAGKPIPEGMMFTGGTPWFDESRGRRRTAREVYDLLYPEKPTGSDGKKKSDDTRKSEGRFPAHWGDPPRIQTRDLRPLPGGYGRGSSTLAKWIQMNLEKDARKRAEDD